MKYEKPEIVVLGDAGRLIQAGGKNPGEGVSGNPGADCELDD